MATHAMSVAEVSDEAAADRVARSVAESDRAKLLALEEAGEEADMERLLEQMGVI